MTTLRTLKKLLLGETWLLPLGMAVVVAVAGLAVKPLMPDTWKHVGGFILLAGVIIVLLAAVGQAAGRRPGA